MDVSTHPPGRKPWLRRSLWAQLVVVALVGLCAWRGWVAAQPELNTFLLQGARDIRRERVGPGMQGLTFSHDGPVVAQTIRLYTAVGRRGWRLSEQLKAEDCEGPCILGQVTLIFTRQSMFDLVHEVVTVDQRGAGPYYVRVVLRRCIRLPAMDCWPPG